MSGKRIPTPKRMKIIKAKLENPDLSSREIEAKTGVKRKTVQKILRQVPAIVAANGVDGKLARDVKQLEWIVSGINEIIERSINKYREVEAVFEPKDLKSITDIAETNRKRSQVLQGKSTDKKEIDFSQLGNKTPKELEEIRQSLLGL